MEDSRSIPPRPDITGQSHADFLSPRARRQPRIPEVPPLAPPPAQLSDYQAIIGKSQLDELRFLAGVLRGKTVKMVNSTAVGGGVAEMLNRLVPLLGELEIQTGWEVITGGNDFFETTKAFHNALHGGEYALTEQARDVFMRHTEQNRQRMNFDEDFIVIHDPQPAGLIASKTDRSSRWIWRCHIDLSNPNAEVWNFLQPMVERYDAAVFSSPAFARQLSIPQALFYPCIDPLSEKNKELEETYITGSLRQFRRRSLSADCDSDFPVRPTERPRRCDPSLQDGQEICGFPVGTRGGKRVR